MDILNLVWLALAGGGGLVAVVLGLFKFYMQNLIKSQSDKNLERVRSQFSKDLEQVRSQFSKDLEQVKSELSVHTRRRMTWQDKEYEVFPEIWTRLCDTRNSLETNVSSFSFIPDFTHIQGNELAKWLNGLDWNEDEKEAMKNAENATECRAQYRLITDRKKGQRTEENHRELMIYLQKNRIFLSPDIKVKIDEITGQLQKSLDEKDQAREGNRDSVPFHKMAWTTYRNGILPLMEKIETVLQEKLHSDLAPKNRNY